MEQQCAELTARLHLGEYTQSWGVELNETHSAQLGLGSA